MLQLPLHQIKKCGMSEAEMGNLWQDLLKYIYGMPQVALSTPEVIAPPQLQLQQQQEEDHLHQLLQQQQ